MKLNFYGQIQGLEEGLHILSKSYNFVVAEDGIPVEVYKSTKNIEVAMKDGQASIGYDKKIHFFRALGLLLEAMEDKNTFEITEVPQFDSNGGMFDCSRNGVLTVDSIKLLLEKMSIMGLNTFMLYTEDTYEVKKYPYFGYLRGRYSFEELKECDDYADKLGIEIVPCIQTLAHLAQVLKWDFANEFKDTDDILLVDEDKTYEFIEEIMKAATAPFRTKRIHIGMDEAHNLGLGSYLNKHGYKTKLELMTTHLTRVLEITKKLELDPMIWSDMYSWNVTEKDDLENLVPDGVKLVYWDYYNHYEDSYAAHIRKHKRFGSDPIYAGGIWTWVGMSMWYNKTFATMTKSLSACKKENLKEVFATMWGDDGQEVNILGAMLGLQFFAEQGYMAEYDEEKLKKRFKFCVGADYEAFYNLNLIDEVLGEYKEGEYYNPSKCLLWQDILLGVYDKHFEGVDLKGHYSELEVKMNNYAKENSSWDYIFDVPEKLSKVLKVKGDIGIRLKNYYDNRDMDALRNIAEVELPELYKSVKKLRNSHRKQWFKVYKPFGWEVLDLRYGGVLSRIESAQDRILDYVNGIINNIDELDEEKLYFECNTESREFKLPYNNGYRRISTTTIVN